LGSSPLYHSFATRGPEFGLHLNLSKCELFWPFGDSFPLFPHDIRRVTGLELLGSPLWGDDDFFKDKLCLLDDRQVELHLLRSCLSSCKIVYLLRTVPFSILNPFYLLLIIIFINVLVKLSNLTLLGVRHHYLLFDDLSASFGIRDQVRLMALAHPSGTSSSWLKAIPQVCLGLAIPGPEFVIGLCIIYG